MENTEYLTARLLDFMPETADIGTYRFAVEDGREFHYQAGQFNMVGFPGVEEAALSFSSQAEPGSSLFEHTVRRVGNLTGRLARLEVGGRVMIRGPFGRGWPMREAEKKDLLLVAGGVGLPPVRPVVLHRLAPPEPTGRTVLIYGARSPVEMVFKEELAAWQGNPRLTSLYCVDRLEGERAYPIKLHEGLVTGFLDGLDLDPLNTLAFVCGPEIMMRFVARQLLRLGYLGNRIFVTMERRMRCGTAHCGHCQIGPKFVCRDGPVFSYPDIARFADTLL